MNAVSFYKRNVSMNICSVISNPKYHWGNELYVYKICICLLNYNYLYAVIEATIFTLAFPLDNT